MPVLAVTQAFPGAGKTLITKYLEKECSFSRFCIEDYLWKRLGRDWWERAKKYDEFWWQGVYERVIFRPAHSSLQQGKSVAVDTTAGLTIWPINHYRIADIFQRNPKAESFLLEILSKPEIRHRRISQRHNIPLEKAKEWDNSYDWKRRWKPGKLPVSVLRYTNNTESDLKRVLEDLKKRFRK